MNSPDPGPVKSLRRGFIFVTLFIALLLGSHPFTFSPGTPMGDLSFTVRVDFPGAFAEEVERTLAIPLENSFSSIPGIIRMVSSAERDGLRMHLLFSPHSDIAEAYQQLRESIVSLEHQFPSGTRRPLISRSDPRNRPVFVAAFPPADASTIEQLQSLFEGQDGAGEVLISGGTRREIRIMTDSSEARDFFPLIQALRDSALFGAFGPPGKTLLRMGRPPHNLEAIEIIPLAPGIRLKDMANIDFVDTRRNGLARLDGKEVIILSVQTDGEADLNKLSRRLRSLAENHPGGVVLYDQGQLLRQDLYGLLRIVLMGWALTAGLLTLGLGRPLPVLLLTLNLPFSALAAVSALSVFSYPLDFTSLSGIILGSGLVSAGGFLFLHSGRIRRMELPLSASLAGGAFFPLLFAPPELVRPYIGFALAVLAQSAASLVYLFFFLTPLMPGIGPPAPSAALLGPKPEQRRKRIKRGSQVIRRKLAAGALLLLPSLSLLCGLGGASPLGTQREKGEFLSFTLEFDAGTPPAQTEAVGFSLDRRWQELPAIRHVWSSCERERILFDLQLRDPSRRGEIRAAVEAICRNTPDGFLYFPDELDGKDSYDVLVTGPDLQVLRQSARELAAAISLLSEVRGTLLHFKDAVPAQVLQLDLEMARHLDLVPAEAAERLYWALSGPVAEKLFIPRTPLKSYPDRWKPQQSLAETPMKGEETDLRVSMIPPQEANLASLLSFPLPLPAGGSVRLGDLVHITEEAQTGRITRTDKSRSASFTVLCRRGAGGKGGKIRKMTHQLIKEHPLPPGITALVAENRRRADEALKSLIWSFLLALPLTFLTLVFHFQSLRPPFFILIQLPFCLSAALLPSLLRGQTLSPPLALGAILVTGPVCILSLAFLGMGQTLRPHRYIGLLFSLSLAGVLPLLLFDSQALPLVQAFAAGTGASGLSLFLAETAVSPGQNKKNRPVGAVKAKVSTGIFRASGGSE